MDPSHVIAKRSAPGLKVFVSRLSRAVLVICPSAADKLQHPILHKGKKRRRRRAFSSHRGRVYSIKAKNVRSVAGGAVDGREGAEGRVAFISSAMEARRLLQQDQTPASKVDGIYPPPFFVSSADSTTCDVEG